jgi:dTDP-4-amino-4,6-dideoxygalactose transaminase
MLNGNSQRLFENGLTLPSGSAMSDNQIELIISSITNFLETKRQNG